VLQPTFAFSRPRSEVRAHYVDLLSTFRIASLSFSPVHDEVTLYIHVVFGLPPSLLPDKVLALAIVTWAMAYSNQHD